MEKFLIILLLALVVSCAKEDVNETPTTIKLTENITICFEDNIVIDAFREGAIGYYWDDPQDSNGQIITSEHTHTFKDTGTYRVRIHYDSIQVISYLVLVNACDPIVFIPTSFSPTGMGVQDNDTFRIFAESISEFEMNIYTSDHLLLYQSTDYSTHGWDGYYLNSGLRVPMGSYHCIVRVKGFRNDENIYYDELILLLR